MYECMSACMDVHYIACLSRCGCLFNNVWRREYILVSMSTAPVCGRANAASHLASIVYVWCVMYVSCVSPHPACTSYTIDSTSTSTGPYPSSPPPLPAPSSKGCVQRRRENNHCFMMRREHRTGSRVSPLAGWQRGVCCLREASLSDLTTEKEGSLYSRADHHQITHVKHEKKEDLPFGRHTGSHVHYPP